LRKRGFKFSKMDFSGAKKRMLPCTYFIGTG
jgi:hypothetical protein